MKRMIKYPSIEQYRGVVKLVTERACYIGKDEDGKAIFDFLCENIENNTGFVGCNFWAWGGLGEIHTPGNVSNNNMEFIGDPAHEPQGWYSVFESDTTTLQLINDYNLKLSTLSNRYF